jgi:hypothetical protein
MPFGGQGIANHHRGREHHEERRGQRIHRP